ncbi:hypothetical protein [Aureispira anguillae]|uniref:Uncharacterized protein n=1 Tax=Aureispira anguillae TaxID=2864201 RepID=A0A916DR99_9BACT|nr:hypothetical protein [Aureispira anguillae]BDS10091.1 hypothetical protein AsAng_0007980 [Aureispira anguillae]
MPSNFSKYETKNHSLIINEENFTEFHQFLLKYFTSIELIGGTIDKTTIKFQDLQDLFNYPNHKERKLIHIQTSCKKGLGDDSAHLSIYLGKEFLSMNHTIRYHLDYDIQDWGFRFDDELNKFLRGFKTKSNLISKTDLILIAPLFVALLLTFYIFYIDNNSHGMENSNSLEILNHKIPVKVLTSFFFLGVLISIFFEKIKKYLFPHIFVALGKQKKEYLHRLKIRNLVFGVIILSLLINILSTFIYSG